MYFIKKLFHLLKIKKSCIVIIFLCISVITIKNYATPYITQQIIDKGILNNDLPIVIKLCIISISLSLLSFAANIIKEGRRLAIYNDSRKMLEEKAYDHLLRVSLSYFNNNNATSIYKVIQDDIQAITSVISNDAFDAFAALLAAIGGATALFRINWVLGVYVLIFIPIDYIITTIFSNINIKIITNMNHNIKKYSELYGETITGVKEIRLFGLSRRYLNQTTNLLSDILSLNKKQSISFCLLQQIQLLLIELMVVSIYIISGYILYRNNISIGGIVAFETYALLLCEPFESAIDMIFGLSTIKPSVERISIYFETPEEASGNRAIEQIDSIKFQNVAFRYNESGLDDYVLKGISFVMEKGDKIALIGDNGVGKSTLLNILLRFYSPENGDILINGLDINDFELIKYRQQFAVVNQNVFLFNTTVKNNICINCDLTDDEVISILKTVDLNDFATTEGMNYNVGENGSKLSGGQKQKIALARALVQDSSIIILDEASSNLDSKSVNLFQKLLENQFADKTVICVTHSNEYIALFPKIMTLKDGVMNLELMKT